MLLLLLLLLTRGEPSAGRLTLLRLAPSPATSVTAMVSAFQRIHSTGTAWAKQKIMFQVVRPPPDYLERPGNNLEHMHTLDFSDASRHRNMVTVARWACLN